MSSQGGPRLRVKVLRMSQDVTDMAGFLKTRLPPLCMESHTMLTVHENLLYLMEICWLPSKTAVRTVRLTDKLYLLFSWEVKKVPYILVIITPLCYPASQQRGGGGARQQICPFEISVCSKTSQENKHYSRQNI